jgi:phage baseplate assembly protein W
MSGWIGSPFAVYPFGAGTPSSSLATPTVPALTAPYIDPRTRDYVRQSDGELARMPRVRQQMLIALTTVVGTMSASQKFGIVLPQKVDDTFARRMDIQVRRACKHIVDALITAVTTEITGMGRVITTVAFTDLTNGLADRVSA